MKNLTNLEKIERINEYLLWIQYADNSIAFEKFNSVEAAEDALQIEKIEIAQNSGIEIIYAEINESLGS
jgi:hypothetical protein